ncbi:MAG TPA: Hsp20/alpha crystallin family protein [Candidatus Binatia bacterium]|nr:Hsp20/alpha crystallin family protein [Candidatus Binatia bacterium]
MGEDTSIQTVPVKVYRTDDMLTVAAPMPGLGPENIVVEVTAEGHLILRGALRGALKDVKQILVDEWTAGPYHREIALPVPVDGERATLSYGNGVLVAALPIAAATRPAHLRLEETGPARGVRVPADKAALR